MNQAQNSSVPSSQEASSQVSNTGVPQQVFDQVGPMEAFDNNMFATGSFDDSLENLDWLNEIDWSRGPWIDLGGTGGQEFATARWG